MKEKDGVVDYPEQQMILYVEKDDGRYGPMQTGSYLSANYMDDYLLKRRNLEQELRNQLIHGLISPIKYYMVLVDLSISELAARASIRKSRLKKHLDPKHFGSATADELRRYAAVFNVPVANLFQVLTFQTGAGHEAALICENKHNNMVINQIHTQNPYLVMTNIEDKSR